MKLMGSGFLATPQTRQRGIVALIGCLFLLNAMTSVSERVLFMSTGMPAAAFAVIPEPGPVGVSPGLILTGLAPLPFLGTPRLFAIANPPTTVLPPAGTPGGIADSVIPQGGAAQPIAQSDSFTPAALNAPGNLSPGSAFNPAAPGGGFFPNAGAPGAGTPGAGTPGTGTPGAGTPGDGTPGTGTPGAGTPGVGTPETGTPGSGTPGTGTPGGGTPTGPVTSDPAIPTPVAALPEPASWLLMIVGFFLVGSMLRRRRSVGLAYR